MCSISELITEQLLGAIGSAETGIVPVVGEPIAPFAPLRFRSVGVLCRTPGRRSAVIPYGGGLDYVLFPGSMRPPRRARVSCHQWWVVVVVSLGSSAPFQAALRSGMGSGSHLPRAPGVGCSSLKGALSCLLANVAPEIGPRWMCPERSRSSPTGGKLGPLGVWGSVPFGSTQEGGARTEIGRRDSLSR